LFLAPDAGPQMLAQMRYAEHYYLDLAPTLLIGLYLTWTGFTAVRVKP
jgi:hypothetical protein